MLSSTVPAPVAPQFKTLSRDECESVLLRNNVGRIAFALHERVSVLPIHYVFQNGWIYGRTASAGKLREILRNRRIAFEVDEHNQLFDWRSVVVHGPFYLIQPDTNQHPLSVYRTAIAAIRQNVGLVIRARSKNEREVVTFEVDADAETEYRQQLGDRVRATQVKISRLSVEKAAAEKESADVRFLVFGQFNHRFLFSMAS